MKGIREAVPLTPGEAGLIEQGANEEMSYRVDTSLWEDIGTITGVTSLTVLDLTNGEQDVSSSVLDGVASVDGIYVITPVLKNLTKGHVYLIAGLCGTDGLNKPEFLFRVVAM